MRFRQTGKKHLKILKAGGTILKLQYLDQVMDTIKGRDTADKDL